MLIASTISEASDTNSGPSATNPRTIHVKFTRIDTTIYLSQARRRPFDTNDPTCPRPSAGAPSRRSCTPPAGLLHRDSSAMVIEMTKFFSGDNELLAPIKST